MWGPHLFFNRLYFGISRSKERERYMLKGFVIITFKLSNIVIALPTITIWFFKIFFFTLKLQMSSFDPLLKGFLIAFDYCCRSIAVMYHKPYDASVCKDKCSTGQKLPIGLLP